MRDIVLMDFNHIWCTRHPPIPISPFSLFFKEFLFHLFSTFFTHFLCDHSTKASLQGERWWVWENNQGRVWPTILSQFGNFDLIPDVLPSSWSAFPEHDLILFSHALAVWHLHLLFGQCLKWQISRWFIPRASTILNHAHVCRTRYFICKGLYYGYFYPLLFSDCYSFYLCVYLVVFPFLF